MTPKEKAKELFNHYFDIQDDISWGNESIINEAEDFYTKHQDYIDEYWAKLANRSALIAVDLIIYHTEQDGSNIPLYQFYVEVKKEIEKL